MQSPSVFSMRTATPADIPTILRFIRLLAEYEKLSHEVTATEEQMRAHLFGEPQRAEVLLACEEAVPVGFAMFFHNFSTFLAKPGLYVEDIFILPEYRGKGYGRALMIQLARIATERKCGRFEWAVLAWNQPSLDFYRSLGAQPMSDWTIHRVSGAALDALAKRPLFE
jgi:GNAT superfamily N-acetyltransferase